MPRKLRLVEEELSIAKDYLLKNSDGKFTYSILQICKKYRISKTTLFLIRDRYKISPRLPGLSKKTEKMIVSDYLKTDRFGLFVHFRDDVCKKYSISQTTLDAVLRRNNVSIRRTRDISADFRKKVVADYFARNTDGWVYTISDISLKHEINDGFIYYILKKEGITSRRSATHSKS